MNVITSSKLRIANENDTRKAFIKFAKELGCLSDLLVIFNKYDEYLKHARTDSDRLDIGKHGAKEVYFLLAGRAGGGDLIINGELIYADVEQKDKDKSIILL